MIWSVTLGVGCAGGAAVLLGATVGAAVSLGAAVGAVVIVGFAAHRDGQHCGMDAGIPTVHKLPTPVQSAEDQHLSSESWQ